MATVEVQVDLEKPQDGNIEVGVLRERVTRKISSGYIEMAVNKICLTMPLDIEEIDCLIDLLQSVRETLPKA